MRELQFGDLFTVSKIVRKTGIKDKLAGLELSKDDPERVGLQLAMLVLENMDQAEKEIIAFIASVAEEKPEDVRRWNMGRLVQFFNDLFNMEGAADFFRSALKTTAK